MSFQDLKNNRQNNEPLKRSDLLGAHGAGGLRLTTWGAVLTRNIERWPLLKTVENCLRERHEPDPAERGKLLAAVLGNYRIHLVEDPRFVRFLQDSRGYAALRYLVSVPQVELSRFNTVKPNEARDQRLPSAEYFPKYLYDPSRKATERHLRTYAQAKKAFRKSLGAGVAENVSDFRFVPPRSARPVPGLPALHEQAAARPVLEPVPLVLICPHGHLADVPWAKFLGAQARKAARRGPVPGRGGLFHALFEEADCCADPQLLWQTAGLSSDSYAGAVLRCTSCKAFTNLGQVNQLRPTCNGGRPWAGAKAQQPACGEAMQRALTTGNNLYYPMTYTGLYLPEKLLPEAPADAALLADLLKEYEGARRFARQLTPAAFWEAIAADPTHGSAPWNAVQRQQLRRDLLHKLTDEPAESVAGLAEETPTARLKRQEYEVFVGHEAVREEADFSFRDVPLPATFAADGQGLRLAGRLGRVRRVEELRLTRVQLAFTRVQPLDPDALDEFNQARVRPQRVHTTEKAAVRVLPALVSRGEGIFLELNLAALGRWEARAAVGQRCAELQRDPANPLNEFQQQLAAQASPRQVLVHTLAHLLIRELEWKCGYPAASIQERLYVVPPTPALGSQGHAGLLLYATEGSQGSMGGLTHQARPAFVESLLRAALARATDCPADPICWHADAQAGSPLVRAACFACTMTSETSCELQNTLLDRRLLIDPEIGFFSADF